MEHKTQRRIRNIDFKSLAIGLLLGLCIMLVSGYATDGDNGRYQCSASENQVFILDTQTGQTWKVDASSTIDLGTPQDRKSKQTDISPIH